MDEPGVRDNESREEVRRDLKRSRRRRNRLIVLIVVTVLMVLLGVANRESVEVEYLVGEGELPLVWVILAAFGAGAVSGRAFSFLRGFGRGDR